MALDAVGLHAAVLRAIGYQVETAYDGRQVLDRMAQDPLPDLVVLDFGMPEFDGEDAGFAINGGRGWKSVVFRNHKIDLNGPTAQAMGDYVFTDATSGDEVRVEYTFGYKRNDDGKVRIYLHHSSVPYAA